jgi:hypothetical protein
VLAELKGELAKRTCKEAKANDRCTWLADNIVEEILANYLRLCPPEPPAEDGDEYGAA